MESNQDYFKTLLKHSWLLIAQRTNKHLRHEKKLTSQFRKPSEAVLITLEWDASELRL